MDRKILGDYTLIRKLGSGTLGDSFLAEHRFIKKLFVVKVLPPSLSEDREFISRFEAFVSAIATLNHPNIATVHNISSSDGYYFVVSDYIQNQRGESIPLSAYLQSQRTPMGEAEVYDLLRDVASALEYTHAQTVKGHPLVHRNLKLSNIVMAEMEGRLIPKLTDVGLASILGEAQLLTSLYNGLCQRTGISLQQGFAGSDIEYGKLSAFHFSFYQSYVFMAPEQRFFREGEFSKAVDVYSFGVLAYFLICRSFPEGRFPMPSEVRSEFTLAWDQLIAQTLNPNPSKRIHSVEAALDLLKRGGEQTAAMHYAPPPQPEHTFSSPYTPPQPQQDLFETPKQPELPPGVQYMSQNKPQTATMPPPQENTVPKTVSQMVQQQSSAPEQPQVKIQPSEILRPIYEPDPGKVFQIESTVAPYKPEEKEVKTIEPIPTDMVVIQSAEFYRGSSGGARDERPYHKVWVSDFALDVHPVTNEQFSRFLEAMGGEKDANNQDIIRLRDSRIRKSHGEYLPEAGYETHPVIGVTWYGAKAYAKWVGKRLPTEAEFEMAARGGMHDQLYSTGEDIDRSQANFFSSDTTPVMSYPPNPFGLYDIVGNVYQWCEDWYGYDYYEDSLHEPRDPKGPSQGVYRVLRGGCWKSLKEDLRCSHRHRNNPATVNSTYGFRCAADVT